MPCRLAANAPFNTAKAEITADTKAASSVLTEMLSTVLVALTTKSPMNDCKNVNIVRSAVSIAHALKSLLTMSPYCDALSIFAQVFDATIPSASNPFAR